MLTLPDYISEIGDAAFAKALGRIGGRPTKTRTVMSWRLRTRFPKKEAAAVIVRKFPVLTYEAIYSVERKPGA